MKCRILLYVSISLLLLIGCSACGDVRIEVSGTYGLKYDGYISDEDGGRSVEGTIPKTYSVSKKGSVAATFQKKQKRGKLKADLQSKFFPFGWSSDSKAETSVEYGVVTVSEYYD